MIVGIHWTDTDKRVDLDLAVIDVEGKHGWDAAYRSENVLFSGDMTAAPKPNGATELFYLKNGSRTPKILTVNYFNHTQGDEVNAKILVASENPGKQFGQNYMVDSNNIIATANVNITRKQNVLGIIDGHCFFFANVSIGNSITSRKMHTDMAREYFVNRFSYPINFRQILSLAGAVLVSEPGEGVLDLSPMALNKTSLLGLLC